MREREEGLNEQGEAPPAYVPKREEGEQAPRPSGGVQEAGISLERIARADDGGDKLPDYYSEVRDVSGEERRREMDSDASASASSSWRGDERAVTASSAL